MKPFPEEERCRAINGGERRRRKGGTKERKETKYSERGGMSKTNCE